MTSENPDVKGTDTPGQQGVPGQPSDAELAAMSREELVELGGRMDGVETVYKEPRWPVEGTKAEKRAERTVAYWLLLGGFSGLALLLVFLFWPWEFKPYGSEGEFIYALATPLYGLTFGLSITAIGIGAVLFQKKFIPEEISIQDRHDGRSPEIQRKTIAANLTGTLEESTLKRRKLIGLSLGIGLGAFGLGTLVAFAGGLIKNPWKPVVPTAEGPKAVLWTSGWTPRFHGETIFLARATGNTGESPFVKMRPEDIDAGGMETVFPWRESDGDGTTVESEHKLTEIALGVRNPVMLIRIKPGDMPAWSSARVRRASTSATCSPTPRSARIWVAPLRFTSSRRIASSARATSRNSTRCTSRGPYSVRLRERWRSCPSPLTKTGIWSPTATSPSPSDRHSGSGAHESETC